MKIRSLFMTSLAFALVFASSALAIIPGDFNGGGESDFTVAERLSNGNTRWTVNLAESGVSVNYDFPGLADAMIMIRYAGLTRPGIVRVLDAKQPLQWQVFRNDGTIRTFYFGQPGDIVPNHYGADFDGDGFSDCYVVRKVNNVLRWFITPNCDPDNRGFYSFDWGVASTDRPMVGDFQQTGVASAIAVRVLGTNLQWLARDKAGNIGNAVFGDSTDIPLVPQSFYGQSQPTLAVARKTASGMQIWFRKAQGVYEMRQLGANDGLPFTGVSFSHGTGTFGVYLRDHGFGAVANLFGAGAFFRVGNSNSWFISPDGQVYPKGQGPTAIGGGGATVDSGGSSGGDNGGDWCGGSSTVGGTTYSSADCTVKLQLPDGGGKNKSNSENSKGVIKMMIDGRYTDDMATDSSGKSTWYLCSNSGAQLDVLREAGTREYGNRRRCYGGKRLSSLNGQRDMTVVAPKKGGGAFCAKLPSNRTID